MSSGLVRVETQAGAQKRPWNPMVPSASAGEQALKKGHGIPWSHQRAPESKSTMSSILLRRDGVTYRDPGLPPLPQTPTSPSTHPGPRLNTIPIRVAPADVGQGIPGPLVPYGYACISQEGLAVLFPLSVSLSLSPSLSLSLSLSLYVNDRCRQVPNTVLRTYSVRWM
jgi:hypothetical protein